MEEEAGSQVRLLLNGLSSDTSMSAEAIQMALTAMPIGISWATVADQKIVFMNRKFTEIFGYRVGDFDDIADWVDRAYTFAEDRTLAWERWRDHLAVGHTFEQSIEPMEIRVRCKDGTIKTVIHSGVILADTGWALATFVDISDRKKDELLVLAAERRARESQAIYHLLLDNSPEMIILAPFDGSPRYVSPAVKEITGFAVEEYLAFLGMDLIHADDRPRAREMLEEVKKGRLSQIFRYRARRKDGGFRWVQASVQGYVDSVSGKTAGYVATVRDISEQMVGEERLASEHIELAKAAYQDELTGIANRRTFNQTIEREAALYTRGEQELSLLMVDVDYFKRYNDRYGHLRGDECLRTVAGVLRSSLRRAADLAARFGGEEFVLLLPKTDVPGAENVARNILQAVAGLALPHEGSEHGIVTVSIGVVSWPPNLAFDPDFLTEQADKALYEAKNSGRNTYRVIDPRQSLPGAAKAGE